MQKQTYENITRCDSVKQFPLGSLNSQVPPGTNPSTLEHLQPGATVSPVPALKTKL